MNVPTTLAAITIGQTPRTDVVPAMRQILPDDLRIVEYGALDGLSKNEIEAYAARPEDVGIVTRLQDDSSVLLSHELVLPRMQGLVDMAVDRDGAELIIILCGADWSQLKSERLVVNPGKLFPATIGALAAGRKLGIIKPDAGQVDRERERYTERGISAAVTSASPYAGLDRLRLARQAGEYLRAEHCQLVWMTCVGMDEAMRTTVADVTGVPVILAQSLLARLVGELLPARAAVASFSAS
jgi:protein AroM